MSKKTQQNLQKLRTQRIYQKFYLQDLSEISNFYLCVTHIYMEENREQQFFHICFIIIVKIHFLENRSL